MSAKIDLENALKDAMRANDDTRKRTLRMALTSIRLAEVEKGAPLDDSAVQSILQNEIKSRQESIEEARRANRPDLIDPTLAEIAVLENFLPQQLSPEELENLASQVIQELGATNIKEMGQVMKVLMPRLQGRAAGDQASQVVRRLLQ
jgi:uncharacterized protein YqeY